MDAQTAYGLITQRPQASEDLDGQAQCQEREWREEQRDDE
jgi:hypothetical protein